MSAGEPAVVHVISEDMDSGTESIVGNETPQKKKYDGGGDMFNPVEGLFIFTSAILIKRRPRPASGFTEKSTSRSIYERN
jgi:hypothetical protein